MYYMIYNIYLIEPFIGRRFKYVVEIPSLWSEHNYRYLNSDLVKDED